MNGTLDSQKLQDTFKYSANPKLLPPTSQNLFNYFRRAKINCTFDLIHRIISRQDMYLTLAVNYDYGKDAVNYDYGKDELRLYIFQQIENSTLPPQFELFMMKTNFTKYLKEMDDIKAVFDYSDAVMYVYVVDRKIKKTAFAAFHFIRDGKKLSVKEMGLSIENGMIDKFEIEPSGQYAYFTMANNLYRTRIEFPGPKIIDSSERVFLEIPMQSEDYIIAIHPRSFLIWQNRNGKREAILFEGLFFKDKTGVRRAKVNEIGCAFGGFQDDRESLRLRFRRKKLN
uniref:Uncharacterized protein n=1 Tax=Panagrolaimus sp. PS1159 TaxID=55785 RepID=A0AC35GCH2_9BILA